MSKSIQFHVKAGGRLYVNGAVLKVDRKVAVEFLNDVTFLLDNHIMQADQANTPLKQVYYVIQFLMMERANTSEQRVSLLSTLSKMIDTAEVRVLREGLIKVRTLFIDEEYFQALKMLRVLFEHEVVEVDDRDETNRYQECSATSAPIMRAAPGE